MNIETIISYFLSAISIVALWLMGNKTIWGSIIGLSGQILWIIYVIITKQWGLMIGVLGYTLVHIRNLTKWKAENK